jgi:hypothetical protein
MKGPLPIPVCAIIIAALSAVLWGAIFVTVKVMIHG